MQLNTASAGELTSGAPVPSVHEPGLLPRQPNGIPSRLLRVERGGGVESAFFAPELAPEPRRARGAKRLGILYERRCQAELHSLFGDEYVASPFLRYTTRDSAVLHGCIPDGIHVDFDRKAVVVIEMKLKYTTEADWQVQALYVPVVQRLFPDFVVRAVVLCKYTDPSVRSPYSIQPTSSVAHFVDTSSAPFGLARSVS